MFHLSIDKQEKMYTFFGGVVMGFGENLKYMRTQMGLSQKKLAELTGTTSRTILNYEQGARLPKNIDIVSKIADVLGTTTEMLINGKEEFVINAGSTYGVKGKREAVEILENAAALFAGGELDDDEMLSFMTRIQTIYLDSKKKAKKFAAKAGK